MLALRAFYQWLLQRKGNGDSSALKSAIKSPSSPHKQKNVSYICDSNQHPCIATSNDPLSQRISRGLAAHLYIYIEHAADSP